MKIAIAVVDAHEVVAGWPKNDPRPALHPAIQALLDGLALRNDIECHVLYGNSALAEPETRQQGCLVYTGLPYRRLPVMGGALLGRFFALRNYVRRLQPDLVHAQGTERESGLVAAFAGFPSVLTLHGNFREIRKIFHPRPFSYYWMAAHLETMVLKRIDAIICISRYVEKITREFKADQFVIPNAVQSRFLEAVVSPRSKTRKQVCCMGTIDKRKNTKSILRACEHLWRKGLEFELQVNGSPGHGQEYFDTFMASLKPWIEKGVARYGGFVPDPVAAIAQADVMVSASLEESFGMNVLEAMAVGTPVVAPRIGGIQDIITEGESGLFYDDVKDCAAQIERLLVDAELWRNLSDGGRKRAREKFAPSIIAEQTINAYRLILKSHHKQKE